MRPPQVKVLGSGVEVTSFGLLFQFIWLLECFLWTPFPLYTWSIDLLGWFALHLLRINVAEMLYINKGTTSVFRGKKITQKFKDTELVIWLKLETGLAKLHVRRVPVGSGGPSEKPYCIAVLWFIFFTISEYCFDLYALLSLWGSYEFINITVIHLIYNYLRSIF